MSWRSPRWPLWAAERETGPESPARRRRHRPALSAPSGDRLEGSYTATVTGGSMTLMLQPGKKFTLSASNGTAGSGTYTKDGDKVTFNVEVNDGKPATEEAKKNPL